MKSDLAALTLLHDLSTRLLAVDRLEPVLQEIVDAAVALVEAERGTLQLIDGKSLRIVAQHGHQPPFLKFFAAAESQASVCGEALKHGERVIVEDVEHSPLFVGTASAQVLWEAGVRAVQSTPLCTRQGRLLGILTTQWSVPHVPDEHDLWRIDLLARQAADLIEHKQAGEALRAANEDLRAQAEQLQTTNEMLQAKQRELEQANRDLAMQEQDLRQHAEALQASQERLALAASGTRIGMYDRDLVTGETLWTGQVACLLGLRPTTTTTVSQRYHYHDWAERVHPDDLPRVEAELRRCMAERTPYEAEYRVVWPDGSVRWLADRGVFHYESDACCTRVLGILMDITERKQAEESLRESQSLLQAVMEGSPNLIYVKGRDGRVLLANPAACAALGRPTKDVIGQSAREFHREDPEVGRAILENDRRIMDSGQTEIVEEPGSKGRTYLSTKAPYRDAAGKVIGLLGISHDITERKRAEASLRASEQRYRRLFEANVAGVYLSRLDGTILDCNDAMVRMVGCDSREEVLGRSTADFYVNPELRQGLVHLLQTDGGVPPREALLRQKDGVILHVFGSAVLLANEQTGEPYVQGVVIDITQRVQAEEALQQSHKTFAELIERAPFGIYIVDSQFRIAQMNAGSQSGAFRNVRPVIGRDFSEAMRILWPEEVAAQIIGVFRHTLETGEPYYSPRFTNPRADVDITESYEWELHRMTLPDGHYGVICYYFDSTKLRAAEEELRLAYARLQTFFDQRIGGIGVVIANAKGDILQANDYYLNILGCTREELTSGWVDWRRMTPPEWLPADERALTQLAERGVCDAYEKEYVRRDGTRVPVLITDAMLPGDTGDILAFVLDITERKRAEEDIRRRAEELATLMDVAPTAVWVSTDPRCAVITGNRAAQRFYEAGAGVNLSAGAIGGEQDFTRRFFQNARELRPEDLPMQVAAAHGIDVRDSEIDVRLPSGKTITILGNASPLFDGDGHVRGSIAAFVDITARKKAEAALRELNATLESKVAHRTAELAYRAKQLQKLTLELTQAEEQERRRIAVILHEDLQQQMAGAKFHLNLVKGKVKDDRLRADLEEVGEILKGAIEQSRSLSRDLSPAVVNMNDLAEVLQWLANRIRAQQGLTVNLVVLGDMRLHSEPLALFLFRAAQEMLFNVVKHAQAREAAIRLRRIGRYACLTVSDQGQGFDPRELKETSGVGLFSIRERTELLGGRFKVKSAKGKGSRFGIMVPDGNSMVAPPPSGMSIPQPGAAELHSDGRVRVLLVDDHKIVREGLAAMLRGAPGIELVGEAPDGREGINLAMGLQPDVVIMDVSMPLMKGDEATRQIKSYLPKTRVIALSMYDEVEKKKSMFEAGAESYILKTISAEDLIAAIRGGKADA